MKAKELFAVNRWILLCTLLLAIPTAIAAQVALRPNRIASELTSGPITTVAGTVHPLTRRAVDLGPLDSQTQMDSMTLNTSLSAAQQADLDQLLTAQQDPQSPQYHQWLTQEQFGARFGLTDADLSKVTGWLAAQGFTVRTVANSRNAITFSGKAWQVETAFHTQLHQYQLDGATHFANTSELRIPAGLAGVMVNVRGLNNFRPKTHISKVARKVSPDFTTTGGYHFLAPGDWATIYDVTSIYSAGYTGTGAHVGVVGQTYAPKSDIDHFRSAAGLSSTKINYHCISLAHCTDATGTSTDGDLSESDLDIEWAGAIAENATVDFIYAAHGDTTEDVIDALQYAIKNYQVSGAVVPVVSMSYGNCELNTTANDASYYLNLAQQANSQGQTIVVAAGDSGAAGCDPHGDPSVTIATLGLSADVPADVPNVTGVGGTILNGDELNPSAYWSASTTVPNTAVKYIPETAWNESGSNGLIAGGGGVSTLYSTPSWQWPPSNFSGTPGRFVPDVSFTASWEHDGYMICTQADYNPTYGTMCSSGFWSSTGYFMSAGGTSASAPAFAGMLTLLTQKYGALGNVNPILYSLASNSATYGTVFHDITTGSNIVPCSYQSPGCVNYSMGYQATGGYDLATGLGSVDGGALYTALANASKLSATTLTLTTSANSVTIGGTTNLTASVSSTDAGTISGQVTFSIGSTCLGTATISGGTATLSNVPVTVLNGFSQGSDTITATYDWNSGFATSTGSTTLTVVGLPTTTTVAVLSAPTALAGGMFASLSAQVTSTSGTITTGTITFKAGGTTLGTVQVYEGAATLNNVSVTIGNGFVAGSNTITASYSGDASFAASSGTTTLSLTAQSTLTTVSSVYSAPLGSTATLSAYVTPSGVTGSVTFSVGNTQLGTAQLNGETATLSNVMLNAANGFSLGSNTVTASYSGDRNSLISSGSGAVVTILPTTTSVSVSPGSANINDTVQFTVTVSPNTATGAVAILCGGYTPALIPLTNGVGSAYVVASRANGFSAGSDQITANYNGDPSHGYSSASTTLTLAGLPTTTTVTASPNALAFGSTPMNTVLTATVSPSTAGGIVKFMVGNTTLYPTVNAYQGQASWTYAVTAANGFTSGTNTITAMYAGDAGTAPSSNSTTVSVASPGYSLSASPTVSLKAGSSTQVMLNLNSTGGYAGNVSFFASCSSCSSQLQYISGSAPQVPLTSGGSGSGTLTISASSSAANHAPRIPWKSGGALAFAVLLGAPFTLRRKRVVAVLLVSLAISLAGFLIACSGGGSSPQAPRSYTLTVTPSGSGMVMNAPPVTITVTVQ